MDRPNVSAGAPADGVLRRPALETLLAWAIWLASLLAAVLGVLLGLQALGKPSFLPAQSLPSWLAGAALVLAYAKIGLFLRLRVPWNGIGWTFLAIGAVYAASMLSWSYVRAALAEVRTVDPVDPFLIAWLNSLVVPLSGISITVLFLQFPDGRPLSPRWWVVARASVLAAVLNAVVLALASGDLLLHPFIANPFALQGSAGDLFAALTGPALALQLLVAAVAVWSMVLRYRRASSVERHQLKWFAFAAALAVAGSAFYLTTAGVTLTPTSRLADVAWIFFAVSIASVPVAAAVAVFRYRLYDIDHIIGRTVVYGALTAILAGLYTAGIRFFNALFTTATGEESDIALVVTTLALATSFTPIKQWLERQVERRFKEDPTHAHDEHPDDGGHASEPSDEDETRRIEEIARRVALEVLASERGPAMAASGVATVGRDREDG